MALSSTSFAKGSSGNRKGCPKGLRRMSPEAGREWAMQHLDHANCELLAIMRDKTADSGVRLRAIAMVQERAWGKVQLGVMEAPAEENTPARSEAVWTPELIAAVQAQIDRARAKLGGAAVLTPPSNGLESQGTADKNCRSGENGQETGVSAPITPKLVGRPGRPRIKKSAGFGTGLDAMSPDEATTAA
jgi:hypothetical protein